MFKLVKDFFWFGKDGIGWVPEKGIYGMGLSFYPNHSKKPNLERTNDNGDFITIRKIKKGEELFIDYDTYN